MIENIIEVFDTLSEEYHNTYPHHRSGDIVCEDLSVMILLKALAHDKSSRHILAGAEHDQVYFEITLQDIEKYATVDDLRTLIEYGVVDGEKDGYLSMFT